ncbi:MAG TPA: N-acetyl-gamma-glutamyl-phosphate reductase [Acidobacteriota bacterium]|jgi:N-acetyl-gamma-glutamyl-phosphate reductase
MEEFNVAVIGATGYSGRELVCWLQHHPQAKPVLLSGSARSLPELKRYFAALPEEIFFPFRQGETPWPELAGALKDRNVKAVFLATETDTALALAPDLCALGMTVIDLSAAFRLRDATLYPQWYGISHPSTELLSKAAYGLSEYYRDAVSRAQLIANPGCYPTSILLALMPLHQWIDWNSPVICDSKSGLTGAGRNSEYTFAEINENCQAYKVGNHRHIPEILQGLGRQPGNGTPFAFAPHLVPMNRGILSTCYFQAKPGASEDHLRQLYAGRYGDSPFVALLPPGSLPQVQMVVHTNRCELGLVVDGSSRVVTVVSAIDNLVKGAAGQAIQNMNIRFGLDESAGLIRRN